MGRWRHGSGWLPAELGGRVGMLGERLGVDATALVLERAELRGLAPQGRVSAGGTTMLLPAVDDWIAVSLARPDDWTLMAAWLGVGPVEDGDWDTVAAGVAERPARDLVAMASLLGLPVARLGERVGAPVEFAGVPGSLSGLTVVDLSTLWAGPLVGRLLADLGADVAKVESTARPDGARRGDAEFFDRLNGSKRSVVVDFEAERGEVHERVASADVVITSARARALDQLGLVPSGQVWLAITGYGLTADGAGRVAFGDDAAVAGGLVTWAGESPCFVGDAIADPLTGLVGTAAVLDAIASGASLLIDLAMADVAASFAPTGSS